jgi:2-polyprenyl-6-hydroxyphenyl methylase/3-demethylubiquinone-9 3-methyltransferase
MSPPSHPSPEDRAFDVAAGASVDAEEVARFAALSAQWWDPKGKFAPLHRFNPVRLGFIMDCLCAVHNRKRNDHLPLADLRLLDIGCGGGLIAEPLARLGASVVGIDAARRNVETARHHAALSDLAVDYRHQSAEALAEENELFDAVFALELVEHVVAPADFLKTCARLVKPSGLIFVATLNRSVKAYAFAIVAAEYLLRWLPRGTHDWRRFLTPDETARYLSEAGFAVHRLTGLTYRPLSDSWVLSDDLSVNYIVVGRKSLQVEDGDREGARAKSTSSSPAASSA